MTLFQVFKGVTLSAAALVGLMFFSSEPQFPRSLIVMIWLWSAGAPRRSALCGRLARAGCSARCRRALRSLVVGADHTGVHLVQEMRRSTDGGLEVLNPIGFIDDDQRLTGHLVEGVQVLGTIGDLAEVLEEQHVEMVIISDADMPAKVVREISRFCAEANVRVKTLPGLSDLQHGRTALSQMRDMRIEDLLGRQPVQLNLGELAEFLRGQRVMVTGAGGSIGSELARQVAGFSPRRSCCSITPRTGSISSTTSWRRSTRRSSWCRSSRTSKRSRGVELAFSRFKPSIVFHAAAHKHVPLPRSVRARRC